MVLAWKRSLASGPSPQRGTPLKSPLGKGGTAGGWLTSSPLLGERMPEGQVRGPTCESLLC
jgi:hypothetical protein